MAKKTKVAYERYLNEMYGDFVTAAPMTKVTSSDGNAFSMTTKEMPGLIKADVPTIRKKLQRFDGKVSGFSFRKGTGGGWCDLWDGKPKFASHYA